MKMKNQSGFTLIELVLVIALLGALAITALPNIFSMSLTNARDNARDAVHSAVQASLVVYAASQISSGSDESYPGSLDSVADGTAASRTAPLFRTVLKGGVTKNWTREAWNCYDYTGDGGTDGYTYDSTAGTFIYSGGACP